MSRVGWARVLGAVAALCVATVGPAAPAADFHPVVLIGSEGDAPVEVKAALLESITQATQRGGLLALSNDLYGTGPAFKKRDLGGPMALVGKALMEIDRILDADLGALQKKLGPKLKNADWTFSTHMTWSDQTNLPPLRDKLLGRQYGMLWTLGEMQMRTALQQRGQAALSQSLTYATRISVVDAAKLPGNGQPMLEQGRRIYDWLATGSQTSWLPLYAGVVIQVSGGMITFNANVMLKPAAMYQKLDDHQLVSAEALEYRPTYFGKAQNVVRMGMQRTYGGRDERPLMRISFGEMATDDIRSLTFCFNKCEENLFKVPTIRLKLTPDAVTAGRLKTVAVEARRALAYTTDIFVMIKEITIDLAAAGGPKVLPERSQMALVLRQKNFWGTVTTQVIDSSKEVYGVNLYQRIVGGALEARMTDMTRQGLQTMDQQSNQALTGGMQTLSALFAK
jgi:hypothetical protein